MTKSSRSGSRAVGRPRARLGAERDVAGRMVHSDRVSQAVFNRSKPEVPARSGPPPPGRLDGQGRLMWRQCRDGILLQLAAEEHPATPLLGRPRGVTHRDRDMNRANLPPTPTTGPTGSVDPGQIRSHHEHADRTGCVSRKCYLTVQQTPMLKPSSAATARIVPPRSRRAKTTSRASAMYWTLYFLRNRLPTATTYKSQAVATMTGIQGFRSQ